MDWLGFVGTQPNLQSYEACQTASDTLIALGIKPNSRNVFAIAVAPSPFAQRWVQSRS
ncbi:MAG: hypothetical protein HC881_20285 [Leptolyngbyaceae cyanobacterium SL_7_1]|nr:hypothetical protein [Leptolyngbyaceae cyanobacterium SL_7_1]